MAEALSSLLDVSNERLETSHRPLQPTNRLVLVGTYHDKVLVGDWTTKKVAEITGGPPLEPSDCLTGLQLVLPTGFLVIFEGPGPKIADLLRAFEAEMSSGTCLEAVKVINCQEDVAQRSFAMFTTKELDVPRSNYADVDSLGLPWLLADTTISFLKIAQSCGGEESDKVASKLTGWAAASFSDSMLSNERVQQLMEITEVPSLDEFSQIYLSPIEVPLKADKVWPPERATVY